jgi:FMN-dependent NADH-azoreductase
MAKILYIESSPRKKRSASIAVAHPLLIEYQKLHPSDTINTIDLWTRELPPFDGDVINSKYALMHNQALTEAERKSWRAVEELIHEFKDADKYIFSLPMWNFSIPYKLKHYIDLIVQPSYTFNFIPGEGFKGLVVNKPALLIYARSGSYPVGSDAEELDMQKKYMETILKFIGFTDIQSIVLEPTEPPDAKEKTVAKGIEEALEKAKSF